MIDGGARVDESDRFARREFDELAKFQASTCVSLYLPTHRAGGEVGQDPIRFRNLLVAVERELCELGWRRGDIEELLGPADQLLGKREWWRHQDAGLAVFIAAGLFRTFRAPNAFEELAVVSARFHLRPLFPLITGDELFWVLALSQNAVRLFQGSRQAITEVDIGQTPTSMAEALAHEDPERQLQVWTSGPAGTGHFHGHGGGGEEDKAALERYFRAVDRGIGDVLAGSVAPLVLAGVSYYGPIYRAVSRYPQIVEEVVAGNAEDLSAVDLHERAWPLVQQHAAARRAAIVDRYARSRGAGRSAEGLSEVSAAADDGRVETLLLARRDHCWVPHDQTQSPTIHEHRAPGDIDLLDELARRVLDTGGDVVVVDDEDVPGAVAAIVRYA